MPPSFPTRLCLYWLPPLIFSIVFLILAGDAGSAANTRLLMVYLKKIFPGLSPATLDLIHYALRKAGHVFEYTCLFLLWQRAWRWHWPSHPHRALATSLILTLLVALSDEGLQSLHASRTGTLTDVLLDISGPLLLAGLYRPWRRSLP